MRFKIALFLFLMFCVYTIIAQTTSFGYILNTITTAVPFITISPDARAGSMGEVGAATIPDIHSLHWNPAKLAFLQDQSGLAMSYTPWLSQLVPDISLAYLTGYSKINENSAWSAALRYFSLGNIQFTDETGEIYGTYDPNEYAFDLGYHMSYGLTTFAIAMVFSTLVPYVPIFAMIFFTFKYYVDKYNLSFVYIAEF